MPYTTIDIVFTKFPAIATAIGTGEYEIASADVVSVFIRQAAGRVDAYLSERYAVPFDASSVPPLIEEITTDLAICAMARDRLPSTPEWLDARCRDAMATLKDLANGTLTIPGATLANTTGDNEIWSTTQEHHPVFSPVLDPVDQAADSDRVSEDLDDRRGDAGFLGSRFFGNCP